MSNDEPKRPSLLAIVALFLSLAQLFPAIAVLDSKDPGAAIFLFIMSIAATIVAGLAVSRVNRQKLGGEGMAVVALLLGGMGCFGGFVGFGLSALGGIQPR